jgi:ligand-binding sensor domain-containing protein
LRSSNFAPDARAIFGATGRLVASVALFCLIDAAYAIDPNRAMSQYVREHWGTEQGFPKGPLYAITQTRDGYLWIGAESGLIRFDGWSFRVIQDPSGILPNSGVLGLAPGSDGSLWILLETQISGIKWFRNRGRTHDRASKPESKTK